MYSFMDNAGCAVCTSCFLLHRPVQRVEENLPYSIIRVACEEWYPLLRIGNLEAELEDEE